MALATRHGTVYVGRFAPSPTGPLHFGSLIGALASYLDARANKGRWLVRIEDLDPPREITGAADDILQCLVAHGLQWDGDILWQSQRHLAYQQAIETLLSQGRAFYCDCSRAQLAAHRGIYPGTCRSRRQPATANSAIRLNVDEAIIDFNDRLQSHQSQRLRSEVGDFVIRRRDHYYAYQLAVVVDDAFQGITDIVRGSDLLSSTARQIYLQQQLALPTPRYLHIPVAAGADGQKLSKQTFAPALDQQQAAANLRKALRFLNQPEPESSLTSPASILIAASAQWQPAQIPALEAITVD